MLEWLTYGFVWARILPVVQDLAEGVVIAGARARAPHAQGSMHVCARRVITHGLTAQCLRLLRGDAIRCAFGLRVNMCRTLAALCLKSLLDDLVNGSIPTMAGKLRRHLQPGTPFMNPAAKSSHSRLEHPHYRSA